MISVDRAIIARYQEQGHKFEILVDPDLAWDFREGESIPIEDILASEEIYKDAKKADRASEDVLDHVFNTKDVAEIAKKIICDGEIQLTTEHRRKILENKRKKIITHISRNSINPKTQKPHPPARIENAMESAKVSVDINKRVGDQIEGIVKKIATLLPIRLEKTRMAVRVEASFGGKAHPILQSFGKLQKEEWTSDGHWIGLVEIPAGLKYELIAKMDSLTKGKVETKIIGRN